MTGAAAFWSYVQKDNDGDHGRIIALSEDLRQRYRIQTGEDLEIFIDREDVEWGVAWKRRIDTAISGTTFFIPVITPSYFKSQACREELLTFARTAERLGLGELVMSVYWVDVPALEDDPGSSSDDVVRIVANYNWQDLRQESLEDRDSASYRKAVAKLAAELAKQAAAAQKVDDLPPDEGRSNAQSEVVPSGQDAEVGILEQLVESEDAQAQATVSLGVVAEKMNLINEKVQSTGEEIKAAAADGQGVRSALTLTNRLAQEIAGPSEELATAGHDYRSVLGKIDPAVQLRFDAIEENGAGPEDEEWLQELEELLAVSLEMENIFKELLDGAETVATFSRSLRAPLGRMRQGVLSVIDGNVLIKDWSRRASEGGEKADGDDASTD